MDDDDDVQLIGEQQQMDGEYFSVSEPDGDNMEESTEDLLYIKPPQASKTSSGHHRKSRSSRHGHSSQSTKEKRERHSKKRQRSKERHRNGKQEKQADSQHRSRHPPITMAASDHRVNRDQNSSGHKHRRRVTEHRPVDSQASSKDGPDVKDAREVIQKIREKRDGTRDKEVTSKDARNDVDKVKERERSLSAHRDKNKDPGEKEHEKIERDKRRERLMMAERERQRTTHRRVDDEQPFLPPDSHSRRSRREDSKSNRSSEAKKYDRSRSPLNKRHVDRNNLNAEVKSDSSDSKRNETEIDEQPVEGNLSGDEALQVTLNEQETITSEDNKDSGSEKEEGEHSDDDVEEDVVDEDNESESQSSSSSDEESGEIENDGEESSSNNSESDSDAASEDDDNESAKEKDDIKASKENEDNQDNGNFLPDSPPESPMELKPKLPPYLPAIQGCRLVEEFHCLNRIEEGTFGVVYRARDKKRNEIVALKRLKMENEKEGFPITSLREINTLLKAQHINIVTVREIVVGSNMDKIYIVMEYVEHDLKGLMEGMKQPFLIGEVKTLMIQLLRAIAHLHDNWILHRDLKTSNLLLSHKGILKVGDFGLAREYGSPLKPYTPVVVTLWYRAPELLLGVKEYACPIDLWSIGCIMGEFLNMKPLFPGRSEIDQLNKIFKDLGTPNNTIWAGYSELPMLKKANFVNNPYNTLRGRFGSTLDNTGFELLNRFLTYDPKKRVTAEEALKHDWFDVAPLPVNPSMFPTWPAKSEQVHRRTTTHSPKPPSGGKQFKLLEESDEGLMGGTAFHMNFAKGGSASKGFGFTLKF